MQAAQHHHHESGAVHMDTDGLLGQAPPLSLCTPAAQHPGNAVPAGQSVSGLVGEMPELDDVQLNRLLEAQLGGLLGGGGGSMGLDAAGAAGESTELDWPNFALNGLMHPGWGASGGALGLGPNGSGAGGNMAGMSALGGAQQHHRSLPAAALLAQPRALVSTCGGGFRAAGDGSGEHGAGGQQQQQQHPQHQHQHQHQHHAGMPSQLQHQHSVTMGGEGGGALTDGLLPQQQQQENMGSALAGLFPDVDMGGVSPATVAAAAAAMAAAAAAVAETGGDGHEENGAGLNLPIPDVRPTRASRRSSTGTGLTGNGGRAGGRPARQTSFAASQMDTTGLTEMGSGEGMELMGAASYPGPSTAGGGGGGGRSAGGGGGGGGAKKQRENLPRE